MPVNENESEKSKFWSDLGTVSGDDTEQTDPRQGEDWKIQRKKGFQKDRENKTQVKKLSKTEKRNSKESFLVNEKGKKGTKTTSMRHKVGKTKVVSTISALRVQEKYVYP